MKNSMAESAGSLGGKKEPSADKPTKSADAKKQKLSVAEVHIRRGHAGGFIAKNHIEDEQGNMAGRPQEYPLTSIAQVVKHIRQHLPSGEAKSDGMKQTPADATENC